MLNLKTTTLLVPVSDENSDNSSSYILLILLIYLCQHFLFMLQHIQIHNNWLFSSYVALFPSCDQSQIKRWKARVQNARFCIHLWYTSHCFFFR